VTFHSDVSKFRQSLPELQDVTSDLQLKNPQVKVHIYRDRAAALGITAGQIEDALNSSYGARQISTIYAPNNAYRVIVELADELRSNGPGVEATVEVAVTDL